MEEKKEIILDKVEEIIVDEEVKKLEDIILEDKIKKREYFRKWYQKNKEKQKMWTGVKVPCTCGRDIFKSHRQQHLKTKIHTFLLTDIKSKKRKTAREQKKSDKKQEKELREKETEILLDVLDISSNKI